VSTLVTRSAANALYSQIRTDHNPQVTGSNPVSGMNACNRAFRTRLARRIRDGRRAALVVERNAAAQEARAERKLSRLRPEPAHERVLGRELTGWRPVAPRCGSPGAMRTGTSGRVDRETDACGSGRWSQDATTMTRRRSARLLAHARTCEACAGRERRPGRQVEAGGACPTFRPGPRCGTGCTDDGAERCGALWRR